MQQLVLIDALVRSQQPDNLKKIIANKLIKQVVEGTLNKKWVQKDKNGYANIILGSNCAGVCQQLTEWILTSDEGYLREVSLDGFNILAKNNKETFQVIFVADIFRVSILLYILGNMQQYLHDRPFH